MTIKKILKPYYRCVFHCSIFIFDSMVYNNKYLLLLVCIYECLFMSRFSTQKEIQLLMCLINK